MQYGTALILSTGIACSTALLIAGKPDIHSMLVFTVSLAVALIYCLIFSTGSSLARWHNRIPSREREG